MSSNLSLEIARDIYSYTSRQRPELYSFQWHAEHLPLDTIWKLMPTVILQLCYGPEFQFSKAHAESLFTLLYVEHPFHSIDGSNLVYDAELAGALVVLYRRIMSQKFEATENANFMYWDEVLSWCSLNEEGDYVSAAVDDVFMPSLKELLVTGSVRTRIPAAHGLAHLGLWDFLLEQVHRIENVTTKESRYFHSLLESRDSDIDAE